MKQFLSTRNLLMATVIYLAVFNQGFAQVPQKTKAPSERENYLEKTVIFRVHPQYRSECAIAGIDDADLQKVFLTLGTATYSKIYPRHKQPETEYNRYHQPLIDLSLIYEVHYTANVTVQTAATRLMRTGKLLYAEPHYIYPLNYTPNDPQIGSQYHIAKINAYLGWDVEKGDTNVVIGIVDSGTDPNHPDLAGNLKHNYADPVNGADDDADGYTDNFSGWDISENDNDATVGVQSHGSHVSGCAAATTDNNVGVAGSGFRCKFLPVKSSLDASANAIDNGYEGIVYAADHGCNVINCSWGGAGGGQYGQDVINYAVFDKNVTMVVSAGNNNNEDEQFPAAYDNVFAVGSTNSSDGKSSFSTFGHFVDFCAPGTGILATVYNNTYATMSGTSMASPVAAGCAAIIKSHFPSYNGLQVGEQLRMTCDNIYGINPGYLANKLGKGRINMYNALTVSTPSIRYVNMETHDNNDDAFVIGDTVRITGFFKNFLAPTTNLTATLSSTSTMVTVLNNTVNAGVINTMDSVSNAGNAFTVKINPTATLNASVLFKITYSDGTYSDFEIFYLSVNVDYINVTVNQVNTTITSKGRIGWNDDGQMGGLGFKYNGNNLMYDGGLMIGVSPTNVSDVIRGTGATNDADFQSVVRVSKLGPIKSDFDLSGRFNDAPASPGMGLLVTHKSYAWTNAPDDKFVIVEYVIKNNTASALTNLYAGTCFDWDIMTYSLNKASVDNNLKMGYAFSTEVAGLYAGSKLLTSGPFSHYAIDNIPTPPSGIDISGGFATDQKYTTLSTVRTDAGGTGTGNDVLDVVSTGPFTINAGDSVTVAFALIAGDDLADLTASAVESQIKYNSIAAINEQHSTNPYSLSVSPNPAVSETHLHFNLSKPGQIKIEVYNTIGKQVMVVENKNYAAGSHSLTLKTASLAPGIYFVKMNNGKTNSVAKFTVLN